jgi:protein-L-isoaspartate(D-aspartate) O-methyltransferase
MSTETDDPAILYQDMNVALLPALRINNGQPSLHAVCLTQVAPRPSETAIHIGAGTGYYTAIIAELVGPVGRIDAYEINTELADRARANLADRAVVTVHTATAVGAALPPADVIYVSAGATDVPAEWLDALTVGGRLVLPLTPDDGPGFMLLVTRTERDTYAARSVSPAYFIPCVGVRDDAASRALAAAIAARSPEQIRSLRRDSVPDESAWCIWPNWWLSTAAL